MSCYLALETEEERTYARQHVRWLRNLASELRDGKAETAAEYEQDAKDLEDAIERRERDLLKSLQKQNH